MSENRVSVVMARDYNPETGIFDGRISTVSAYLDGELFAQGWCGQWHQVVAYADVVARSEQPPETGPFGYIELSFEDLEEWYREFIEGGGLEMHAEMPAWTITEAQCEVLNRMEEDGQNIHTRPGMNGHISVLEIEEYDHAVIAYDIAPDGSMVIQRMIDLGMGWEED